MSLAAARFVGQVVSGVEVARARSAGSAWNVGKRAVKVCRMLVVGGRGRALTVEVGGVEYRLQSSMTDRLVVVMKLL